MKNQQTKTNIFFIMGKTNAGKSFIFKTINMMSMNDRLFRSLQLSPIVYGTTRNKRSGEVNGLDYIFFTDEEFQAVPKRNIIECRTYYTSNDGRINYFTLENQIKKCSNNIICGSPYQYAKFKEYYKDDENVFIYPIIIQCDIVKRLNRGIDRASNNNDVKELCRRISEEDIEWNEVSKNYPEVNCPSRHEHALEYLNEGLLNLKPIYEFINKKIL